MSRPVRNALTFLGVLALALLLSMNLSPVWLSWFMAGRTFGSSFTWWFEPQLLDSSDEILVMLIAGATLTLSLHVRRPIVLAFLLGAAFGFVRWSLGREWVADANASVYFWAYFLPVLGAIVGAAIVVMLRALHARRTVA